MSDKFEPLKLAAKRAADAAGIDEYELYYIENGSISAETFRDEISSFSSSVGGKLMFRCVSGGKLGYASTELLTEDEVEALVARAVENAGVSEKDEEAIIFGGAKPEDYLPTEKHEFAMPDGATIKKVVMDCRNTLYAADERIADGTECAVEAGESTIYLSNSKGLNLSNHVGNTLAYMFAVIDDGREKVFDYDMDFNNIENFDREKLAEKVVDGAKAKLGAGAVRTGKYDIIFDTSEASSILSTFFSVFVAENAQKGLSLLKGRTGEKIAADSVTIVDDPFYPGNTMQINFDGEGVPTRTKNVVEDGTLKTLLYNLSSAKKDGVQSTGNAARVGSSISTKPYVFYIKPGETSREDLFAKVGNGIYVTEMKGFHAGANAVTGDFSIESAGFMIEDGKKGRPVKSFTVAGNFFELLKSIDTIGSEIDLRRPGYTNIAAPDILVRGMSVAGE